MPEPLDREAFLRAVAEAVDLQPGEVAEVREEINGHLSDAAAGWREAGLDADDAERRAIASLGDPAELGRELGEARHTRRRLLAAVGGAALSVFGFGLASLVLMWLLALGVIACSILALMTLQQVTGISVTQWLTGPAASVGSVVVGGLWFAWMGWVLPARVARRFGRSVRGVRLGVGLAGLVVGSVLLWCLLSADLDWVLAIGLPLGPVAFLLGAFRSSEGLDALPRTTPRLRLGLFSFAVVSTLALGSISALMAEPPQSWVSNTDSLGHAWNSDPVLGAADGVVIDLGDGPLGGRQRFASFALPERVSLAEFTNRFAAFELDVWPVSFAGREMQYGAVPLAARSVPASSEMTIRDLDVPALRTPVLVETVAVLVARDGTRILLGEFGPNKTPAWHGTLLDWWVAGR